MTLEPLGDRLVIKPIEIEEKTVSGIVLPTSAKEEPTLAEVIEISDKLKDENTSVKIGDKIVYTKYSGTEIKLDSTKYIIIKLEDVLAVVK